MLRHLSDPGYDSDEKAATKMSQPKHADDEDSESKAEVRQNWSNRNGIEINKIKSGIIQVRKDRRTPRPIARSYMGYPIVDEYKYLGVLIDSSLSLQLEVVRKKRMETQLLV